MVNSEDSDDSWVPIFLVTCGRLIKLERVQVLPIIDTGFGLPYNDLNVSSSFQRIFTASNILRLHSSLQFIIDCPATAVTMATPDEPSCLVWVGGTGLAKTMSDELSSMATSPGGLKTSKSQKKKDIPIQHINATLHLLCHAMFMNASLSA